MCRALIVVARHPARRPSGGQSGSVVHDRRAPAAPTGSVPIAWTITLRPRRSAGIFQLTMAVAWAAPVASVVKSSQTSLRGFAYAGLAEVTVGLPAVAGSGTYW